MNTARRPPLVALAAALLGVALGLWQYDAHAFWPAYLAVYVYVWGLSMGSLALLMIHALTGGRWGVALRPVLQRAAAVMPVVSLMFLPLLAGRDILWPWSVQSIAPVPDLMAMRAAYLAPMPYFLRLLLYFACWNYLAWTMRRVALTQEPADAGLQRRAALGLVLYTATVSFAAFDWLMSLQADFTSTLFGLLIGVGQMLSAAALAALSLRDPDAAQSPLRGDIGNLLLMFVMLWAYLAYMQYLIIWYENLPREIAWYVPRLQTGWHWLGMFLLAFHLVLPFLILLFRTAKRSIRGLSLVAGMLLVAHLADSAWLVLPGLRPPVFHAVDLAAVLIVGGIWAAAYARRPVAPPAMVLPP